MWGLEGCLGKGLKACDALQMFLYKAADLGMRLSVAFQSATGRPILRTWNRHCSSSKESFVFLMTMHIMRHTLVGGPTCWVPVLPQAFLSRMSICAHTMCTSRPGRSSLRCPRCLRCPWSSPTWTELQVETPSPLPTIAILGAGTSSPLHYQHKEIHLMLHRPSPRRAE